jgi:tetratricopeptide (TPR) repeat protein
LLTPEHESKPGTHQSLLLPGMKKILPFWCAAMTVALVGILLLHHHSIRLINYIEYPDLNPLILAESYRQEGEKLYQSAARSFARLKEDPARSEKMKNLPDLQKARNLFLECLNLKPAMKGVYQYLADLATFEGDLSSMYLYQGKRALSDNEIEAALEAFDQALILKKDFRPALEMKILTLVQKGNGSKALESFNTLFEQIKSSGRKPDAQVYYLRAQIAFILKNDEEYLANLEESIHLDPGHVMAVKDLATLLASKGQYDRAIGILQKTISHAPRDAHLLHGLGQISILKGDYEGARKSLEAAVKLEKYSAPLYFDLARVYEKIGKKSHATIMLQKAIEIDPKFKNRILFPDQK